MVFFIIIFLVALGYYLYTLIYLFRKLAVDGGYGIDSAGSIIKFAMNPFSIFILYSCFFRLEDIVETKKSFYRNLLYSNILSYMVAVILIFILFFGNHA
jgi:hypothetical protein